MFKVLPIFWWCDTTEWRWFEFLSFDDVLANSDGRFAMHDRHDRAQMSNVNCKSSASADDTVRPTGTRYVDLKLENLKTSCFTKKQKIRFWKLLWNIWISDRAFLVINISTLGPSVSAVPHKCIDLEKHLMSPRKALWALSVQNIPGATYHQCLCWTGESTLYVQNIPGATFDQVQFFLLQTADHLS